MQFVNAYCTADTEKVHRFGYRLPSADQLRGVWTQWWVTMCKVILAYRRAMNLLQNM